MIQLCLPPGFMPPPGPILLPPPMCCEVQFMCQRSAPTAMAMTMPSPVLLVVPPK